MKWVYWTRAITEAVLLGVAILLIPFAIVTFMVFLARYAEWLLR